MRVPAEIHVRRGVWSGGLHLSYWCTTPTMPGAVDRIVLVSEAGDLSAVLIPWQPGIPKPRPS